MIKIGTRGNELARKQANSLSHSLNQKEIKHSITIYDGDDDLQTATSDNPDIIPPSVEVLRKALLKGEIDLAIHPLTMLPAEAMSNVVIAGLSDRTDPSDLLLIHKKAYAESKAFKLKDEAVIGTSSKRRKALLTHFREDIQIRDLHGTMEEQIEALRQNKYDGIIVAKADVELLGTDITGLEPLTLNPREFIPAPGQGVVAYQTRADDIDLRKEVARWTNRKLVRMINVERKIQKLTKGTIGAFCETDALGHFHVWTCLIDADKNHLNFVQYSSSTIHQLAETIVKKLNNDIDI